MLCMRCFAYNPFVGISMCQNVTKGCQTGRMVKYSKTDIKPYQRSGQKNNFNLCWPWRPGYWYPASAKPEKEKENVRRRYMRRATKKKIKNKEKTRGKNQTALQVRIHSSRTFFLWCQVCWRAWVSKKTWQSTSSGNTQPRNMRNKSEGKNTGGRETRKYTFDHGLF